ncbi:hypothetical protein [Francisella marina]|uniref:DGQHR domain-containing protein n=1 Tax=Francisella marina TaxID=2249302 RepID=A0ABX5ZFS8_9GAMM|nr:hypothetical protein [Francisella marina]QEO57070.1 hypothetical protein F0R74_04080 [Francisella marina]QEO58814.1 hypothetical protein F0R75_03150 [Francisella marina]
MAIELKGIINSKLGNICLRGEANIKDLIRISEPDQSYQREADTKQLDRLKKYIKEEAENRYFPELTFALKIDGFETFNTKLRSDKSVPNLKISDKISMSIKKVKSTKASRAVEEFELFTLSIEENQAPLFRIDGNHRLEAAKENDGFLTVSFTIVLFNDEKYERTAPIIFNNINYKQLPISKEQNIKRIIEGKYKNQYIYDDDELVREFGNFYPMIRKLGKIDFDKGWVDEKVKKEPYETTHDILEEIFKNENLQEVKVEKIKDAIDKVISCFDFCTGENLLNKGVLVAGVRTILESENTEKRLKIYKNWVLKQHLLNIYVKGKEIYKIFSEYLKTLQHTIFVSMPFNNESTVENPYNSLKNVIDKINREYNIDLELFRIDKQPKISANDIPKAVLDGIRRSGLLIANLSDDRNKNINGNVYHEIGYAMGLEQSDDKTRRIKLIKHKNTEIIGFNIRPNRYLEYDDNMEGFEKNMKQELLDFYELSEK